MRFGPGDVLGIKAFVKIYRGVDAAHDFCGTTVEATPPQRICWGAESLIAWFFGACHAQQPEQMRERRVVRWSHAVASLILLIMLGDEVTAEGSQDKPERIRLGEFIPVLPPLRAPAISFVDLAGNTVSLSEFTGKMVLVNLWATWCEPCLREMPSLARMQSHLGDKITVVAVSEDRGGSKAVEPFIGKLGLKSIKTYLDPKSTAERAFKVQGLPTSFLIDRQGRILGRVEGAAEWDAPKLLETLKSFLNDEEIIRASFRRARP
jgi:thiol-disulfide isomerase/thioredoxin